MPFPFFGKRSDPGIEEAKKLMAQKKFLEAQAILLKLDTPEAQKLRKELDKQFIGNLKSEVSAAKKKAGVRGNVKVTGTGFKKKK
jgi:hypothetical protein